MSRILDVALPALLETGWHPQQVTGSQGDIELWLTITGDHNTYRCLGRIWEAKNLYEFYTFYPEKVPEKKRQEALEYIDRVNYSLFIGNLEMDMDSGEVRFRANIDVEDAPITKREVTMISGLSLLTADKFWPGLAEILHGRTSPKDAFAHAQTAVTS